MTHDFEFFGKYLLSGQIKCITGLHIGGSTAESEIGGLDNPVIKDPLSDKPYIPGSSLKGKLRSLLEWKLGRIEKSTAHNSYTACSCGKCAACIIFGVSSDQKSDRFKAGPTRLTVRDAFPTPDTEAEWTAWLGENIYTEIKTENTIDRVTAEANPRPMERVPRASIFEFEMIFDVYRAEDTGQLKELFSAMRLLEQSALGGSGSRGYGQIEFSAVRIDWRPVAYYTGGRADQIKEVTTGQTVSQLMTGFETFDWPRLAAKPSGNGAPAGTAGPEPEEAA